MHSIRARITPYVFLSVGANYLFAGGHWTKINGVSTSPYFAAFTLPPLKPASALKFTQIQSTSVNVEWTNGSGERRFVIVSDAHIPKGPTDWQNLRRQFCFSKPV
jgi:prepilin-type processing-associated H-X9-DG protein